MVALLLCYCFTALCTSKGDISASAIYYLWRFFLAHCYIGRHSQGSLVASLVFPEAFICLCSLCCNMLSANDSEVVDREHELTLLRPSIFLQVSSDHRCCGQGPPVPKRGIIITCNSSLCFAASWVQSMNRRQLTVRTSLLC